MHELKIFSNDLIKTIGVIKTSGKCNDCVATDINVTVVEDGHRPIIGRKLFSQLGSQSLRLNKSQILIKTNA